MSSTEAIVFNVCSYDKRCKFTGFKQAFLLFDEFTGLINYEGK